SAPVQAALPNDLRKSAGMVVRAAALIQKVANQAAGHIAAADFAAGDAVGHGHQRSRGLRPLMDQAGILIDLAKSLLGSSATRAQADVRGKCWLRLPALLDLGQYRC